MNWLEKSGSTASPQVTLRANRAAFEPVAFLLAVMLFGWFLLRPGFVSYTAAGGEVERLDNQKKLLEAKKAQLSELTRQLTSKKTEIEKLEEFLPINVDPASLYYLIEQISVSAGLLGPSITVSSMPKEVVAGSKLPAFSGKYELREMEVSVKGSGTTDQLQGMLKLIETAPRLLEVKNLEISTSLSGQLVFTVQVIAYSYAPVPEESKKL